MRYLYNCFKKLTNPIRDFYINEDLKKLGLNPKEATINEDGSIDYVGYVDLRIRGFNKIPLKFGKVVGVFNCSDNELTSLENAPHTVLGDFVCSKNKLISLEHCPKTVDGSFYCGNNNLKSLEHCPREIKYHFDCSTNFLENLKHCPVSIGKIFTANCNYINTLEYFPDYVGTEAYLFYNEVQDIDTLKQCFVGRELLIGDKLENQKHEKCRKKSFKPEEIALKFKRDEILLQKEALSRELSEKAEPPKRRNKL